MGDQPVNGRTRIGYRFEREGVSVHRIPIFADETIDDPDVSLTEAPSPSPTESRPSSYLETVDAPSHRGVDPTFDDLIGDTSDGSE